MLQYWFSCSHLWYNHIKLDWLEVNVRPGLLFAHHQKSLSLWLCCVKEWVCRWAAVKLWKLNYDKRCLTLSKLVQILFSLSTFALLIYFSCSAPAEIFLCSCDPLPSIALPLFSLFLSISLSILCPCSGVMRLTGDQKATGWLRVREREREENRSKDRGEKVIFFFSWDVLTAN